jgi:hypothetical protein
MQRQTEAKVESRNAVVQAVYPDDRYALVRIQGSAKDIVAYYPLAFQSTPSWCKPLQPVIISHTGGIRSRIELVGPGLFVPTAQAGEVPPVIPGGEDTVLTGCLVKAMIPETMHVYITAGTFRINGLTCTLAADTGEKDIDAAPDEIGHFRLDYIVIGDDSVIHVEKGAEFTDIPVWPTVPDDHAILNWVLLSYGKTVVTQGMIGQVWTIAIASGLSMVIADDELEWDELTTDVAVYVQDQYGGPILPAVEWEITMSFLSGNGEIDGTPPPGTVAKTTATDHAHFTYERDQLPTDASPTLLATLTSTKSITVTGQIILLDENGDAMTGEEKQSSVFDLTSATDVTVNWSKYKNQRIVLLHDVVFTFAGAIDGDKLLLIITQNDALAKTVILPVDVRFSIDLPSWTMPVTLGARSYIGLFYDGPLNIYDFEAKNESYLPIGSESS